MPIDEWLQSRESGFLKTSPNSGRSGRFGNSSISRVPEGSRGIGAMSAQSRLFETVGQITPAQALDENYGTPQRFVS